jgi:phosphatidylinositol alpha-mannosyltransferase
VAAVLLLLAGLGLAAWALERLGFARIGHALLSVSVPWALLGLLLMCTSLVFRAESWYAVLRAAGARVRRRDAVRGTMIGVLMSAALPGRLGEPARALIVSRRLGDTRRWFATVAGTVFAQTLINIVALVLLGAGALAGPGLFKGHTYAIVLALTVPLAIAGAIVVAPPLFRRLCSSRIGFVRRFGRFAEAQVAHLRRGLVVFRNPRTGAHATIAQLCAWGLQWMSCYMLIRAFGLDHGSGLAEAAGVLFAVNVSAAVPVTPSNVGIFQAACIVVLAAYGVSKTGALAYGIALQALEVTTALLLGVPALVSEGVSWNTLRERADELARDKSAGR